MRKGLLQALVARGLRVAGAAWPTGRAGERDLKHRCNLLNSCTTLSTSGDLEPAVRMAFTDFVKTVPQMCVGCEGLAAVVRLCRHQCLMGGDRELLLGQLSRSWTTADQSSLWTLNECADMLYAAAAGQLRSTVKEQLMESLMIHVQVHHQDLDCLHAARVLWALSFSSRHAQSAAYRLGVRRATMTLEGGDVPDESIVLLSEAIARAPVKATPPALSEALGVAMGSRCHLELPAFTGSFAGHRALIASWWSTLDVTTLTLPMICNALKLVRATEASVVVLRSNMLHKVAADIAQAKPEQLGDIASIVEVMVGFGQSSLNADAISNLSGKMLIVLEASTNGSTLPFAICAKVAVAFACLERSPAAAVATAPWAKLDGILCHAVASLDMTSPEDYAALSQLLKLGRQRSCQAVAAILSKTVGTLSAASRSELLRCIASSCTQGATLLSQRTGALIDKFDPSTVLLTRALVDALQERRQDSDVVALFSILLKRWEQLVPSESQLDGTMRDVAAAVTPTECSAAAAKAAAAIAGWVDVYHQRDALHQLLLLPAVDGSTHWLETFLLRAPMQRDGVVPALAGLPLPDLLLLVEATHALSTQSQPMLRSALTHNVFHSVTQAIAHLEVPLQERIRQHCVVMLLLLEELYRWAYIPEGVRSLARALLTALHQSPEDVSSRQAGLLAAVEVLLVGESSRRASAFSLE